MSRSDGERDATEQTWGTQSAQLIILVQKEVQEAGKERCDRFVQDYSHNYQLYNFQDVKCTSDMSIYTSFNGSQSTRASGAPVEAFHRICPPIKPAQCSQRSTRATDQPSCVHAILQASIRASRIAAGTTFSAYCGSEHLLGTCCGNQ